MSWNGSNNQKVERRGGGGQRNLLSSTSTINFNYKALIAGLVVVLGAAIAACLVFGRARPPSAPRPSNPSRPSRISDATPSAARTNAAVRFAAKADAPDPDAARPTRVGEVVNGYIMMPSGEIHKMTGVARAVTPADPSQIFDNPAENEIAALLTMVPGEGIVGGPDRETFTEEFLKSTTVPIIVRADDPEEVKQLKNAVIQAKIELKEAHDRGEDIVDIVEKAYDDFQRLEQYKTDLFSEVNDASQNDEATDEEVVDLLAAANKMLKEKGIGPLDENDFVRTKLEYDYKRSKNQ